MEAMLELDQTVTMLILCSPHNPIGRVWRREELERLGQISVKYNLLVVSDEIHADLVYEGSEHIPFSSISADLAARSITCVAPSKTFNLLSMHAATVIIPNDTLRAQYNHALNRLGLDSPNTFGSLALETAYREGEEWLNELLIYLQSNIHLVTEFFKARMPQIRVIQPEGTYLIWLDCLDLKLSMSALEQFFAYKAKVILQPGYSFGEEGTGFMRMNAACHMGVMDWFREQFSGQKLCPIEHLESYKRLGEQVYSLHVELAESTSARAQAIVQAARSIQIMADELLGDALDGAVPKAVPIVTHDQADVWYGMLPDIMVAARQEAAFSNSARMKLPIRLGTQIEGPKPCPEQHIAGLRRAAAGLEELLALEVSVARGEKETYKEAILLYEEARTRKQAGDSIVGTISNGRRVSEESHEDAEEQYWMALSNYILVAQGLKDPEMLKNMPTALPGPNGVIPCKLDSNDLWKVTSQIAISEIRKAGEYLQAERDLVEHWENFIETRVEREYETTVEELLKRGHIKEDSYWYCCPFPAVYRVQMDSVNVLGHVIPRGHVFVFEYGDDGEPGRFITQPTFQSADERKYCDD
ncbi:Aminotransferase class I and II [Paenibacillus sp. OV219]|nr:Aminotransferase class I and II [Paenibacillus sp. OV219]